MSSTAEGQEWASAKVRQEGDELEWLSELELTAGECDAITLWSSAEGGEQYRDQVSLEDSNIMEDPRDCPVVVLLVHPPEPLQILQTSCEAIIPGQPRRA